jgi:hypothetical protein
MKSLHYLSFGALFVISLYSCRKETVDNTTDRGGNYYPYAQGLWWEYDVDSTFYNDFSSDTLQVAYRLREEFVSEFSAETESPAIRVEQFRKYPGQTNWVGPRVYWTYLTENGAVKVEENIPYVKINYPVSENVTWNGNRYNFFPAEEYTYLSVDKPYTINGFQFDSTAVVLQKSTESLLGRDFYQEKYARRVGLIEKEIVDIVGYIDVDNIPDTLSLPLNQRIRSGIIYRQKIADWGLL